MAVIHHAACRELTGMAFSHILTEHLGKCGFLSNDDDGKSVPLCNLQQDLLPFAVFHHLKLLFWFNLQRSRKQKSFRGGESSCLLQMTLQGD